MALRLITSGVGLGIFFAVFFANELIFSLAVMIVAAGMVYEAVNAIKPGKIVMGINIAFSFIIFLLHIFLKIHFTDLFFFEIVSGIFICLILSVILFNKIDFKKIYSSFFVMLYFTVFMMFVMHLRTDYGRYAVIPVFLFSWITDTGAYFTGSLIGKHKLAPDLSPKKTIEGAIGGIVATVLGTIIYIIVLKYAFNINFPSDIIFVAGAAIGACLSEVGDLAASVIKRTCQVKDFGWIFPGHGGITDRFDSVVFIAPYVYFIFMLMDKLV